MEEEIRKEAIRRHIGGESPKAVYTSLNRSKKWFFKWLSRYQSGAADWYKERSRAPLTRPTRIAEQEKDLIVATRTRLESEPYAQVGVSAINWELHKMGASLRSDSTVNRVLKNEGLVKKNRLTLPRASNIRTSPRRSVVTTSIRWTWLAPVTSKEMADSIH